VLRARLSIWENIVAGARQAFHKWTPMTDRVCAEAGTRIFLNVKLEARRFEKLAIPMSPHI